MNHKSTRILAIDPGTRLMGAAVLEKGKLIYHAVEVINKGQSPNENLKNARKTVLRLVKDFRPQALALEKTFFGNNRNVGLLNVLGDEIVAIAKRKGLKLLAYSPMTIKKYICGNGKAGKEDVARVVVSLYPELKVYLTQDRAWKARFHHNMFDAVALGVMAEENIK